jgi:hypothetical protein
MGQEGRLGALVPGAAGDLLVVDGDPEASLAMLAEPEAGIRLILQGGRRVKDRLAASARGPRPRRKAGGAPRGPSSFRRRCRR